MIRGISFLLVLVFSSLVFSQVKPLTQPEFVKMLYGLQKTPATKEDIIAGSAAAESISRSPTGFSD